MANVILGSIKDLNALKAAMDKAGEVSVRESVDVKKYTYLVWDRVGDHYETFYAESEAEAREDLRHSIEERAHIYEGKVHYRLADVA